MTTVLPESLHLLVGLLAGVVSLAAVRSEWLRRVWVGLMAAAACLPDLLEWAIGFSGMRLPHSACASGPVLLSATLAAVVSLYLTRLVRWPAIAMLIAALWSHALIDAFDRPQPSLWPLSAALIDWRGVGLTMTAALFALAAASGVAWRFATMDFEDYGGLMHPAQVIGFAPIGLLAAIQVHGQHHLGAGVASLQAHRADIALEHFARASWGRPLGISANCRYYEARARMALGEFEEGGRILQDIVAEDPRNPQARSGLVLLLRNPESGALYDPHRALAIANELCAEHNGELFDEWIATVRDETRTLVGRRNAAAPETTRVTRAAPAAEQTDGE